MHLLLIDKCHREDETFHLLYAELFKCIYDLLGAILFYGMSYPLFTPIFVISVIKFNLMLMATAT
jgi:hypothetical protein